MGLTTSFVDLIYPELSQSSRDLFENLICKKAFKKGDTIVNFGEVTTNFYILTEGVIRSFTRGDNGKEYMRTLYVALSTSGSLSTLITKKPSREIYECLTDCAILVGDFPSFIKLTELHHDLAIFYYKVMENIYLRVEKRVYQLAVLNATDRYLNLKKDVPNIENLIPQYHIASSLNITPVQLSRIRKELYSK